MWEFESDRAALGVCERMVCLGKMTGAQNRGKTTALEEVK